MYSPFKLAVKYLDYYLNASNSKGHGMHSPFVFEFITKVLHDSTKYPAYHKVEELRKQLFKDKSIITIEDFGAGSKVDKRKERSIASIARNAAKPAKYGQLLYRVVRYYQPRNILELGTSLGMTTSYFSLAKPDARLVTMEGAAAIAATARRNFATLNLQNIFIQEGNFDQTLASAIAGLSFIDFAFIDGNHRQEPTERYFNQLLQATHNNSILIFDDIHWSKEMEDAWGTIKQHPAVRCTIDLFFIGIVLFRHEFKEKQHFSIRF
ncbi:MAG: O-methyltransferase [Chitinophagaceae bacterium]